jgi:hypothetical protein
LVHLAVERHYAPSGPSRLSPHPQGGGCSSQYAEGNPRWAQPPQGPRRHPRIAPPSGPETHRKGHAQA